MVFTNHSNDSSYTSSFLKRKTKRNNEIKKKKQKTVKPNINQRAILV